MRERQSSEIVIHTVRNGSAYAMTVPITSQSKRKFQLMSEDSITLVFSLTTPHRFLVGDYIEDPIFGLYAIREEQMPAYNQATGGYDYTLRFDAAYWMFENHVFMLTYEKDDAYTRVETKWCLTGILEEHVKELMHNVEVLSEYGLLHTVQWAYDISTAEKRGEARFLSYDGVHILSALNMIAEEYETEWWVTHEDNTYTLHMGKCGGDGEPEYEMELGKNVETMGISRNQNTFANKLYVLGGTKNIPESYGRKLILNIDQADNGTFRDSQKIITPSMLLDDGVYSNTSLYFGTMDLVGVPTSNKYTLMAEIDLGTQQTDESVSWSGVSVKAYSLVSPGIFLQMRIDARVVLVRDNVETVLYSGSYADMMKSNDGNAKQVVTITTQIPDGNYQLGNDDPATTAAFKVRLYADVSSDMSISKTGDTDNATGRVGVGGGKAYKASVVWEGTEYPVTFNPSYLSEDRTEATYFSFDDGTPQGFSTGEDVELIGYDPVEIEIGWYADDIDDPASLLKILERRLHLPTRIGGEYISKDGYIIKADKAQWSSERIVESLVTNESIYPKLYLRVTSVTTSKKVDVVKYGDNSTREYSWDKYTLTLEQISGDPFPMTTRYITQGEKLQAVFLSDIDTEKAYHEVYGDNVPDPLPVGDYLLAGMTFDIEFNEGRTKTYALVRNEDYGAKLPNSTLRPTEGDVLVITGWNVSALNDLGLIDLAEQSLFDFAQEYLDAIEEGQFVFDCHMMSDWPFCVFGKDHEGSEGNPWGWIPMDVLNGSQVAINPYEEYWTRKEQGEGHLYFYVRNENYYVMPREGTRVRIIHGSLPEGEKVSRVIGYEFKLDKPYDSPTYTIGETDAYSRLKKIERQLNKM